MQAKVGSFQIPYSPGAGITQTITGVGFQPVAVIFMGHNGYSFGASRSMIGFDDGTMRLSSAHNVGNFSGSAYVGNGAMYNVYSLLKMGNTASQLHSVRGAGYISSFNSDGFTIQWAWHDDNDNPTVAYLALGAINAKTLHLGPGTPGNEQPTVITGLGFRPKGIINFFSSNVLDLPYGGGPSGFFGFGGFNSVCGDGRCAMRQYDPNDGFWFPDQHMLSQFTTESIGLFGISSKAYVSSYDPDGFKIFWTSPDPVNNDRSLWYGILALGGGVALNVGRFTSITSVGSQTIVIPGSMPKAIILMTNNKPANTVLTDDLFYSTGFSDGTNQIGFSTASRSYQPTPGKQCFDMNFSNILTLRYPTSDYIGTVTNLATVSLAGNSFTVNWSLNDGVAKEVGYCVLVESSPANDCGVLSGNPGAGIYKMTVERPHDTLYM